MNNWNSARKPFVSPGLTHRVASLRVRCRRVIEGVLVSFPRAQGKPPRELSSVVARKTRLT